MAINWYPGHMHKTRREINKALPNVDLIIEILDARLPISSTNPIIHNYCCHKPSIKILNKADLACQKTTQDWLQYFQKQQNTNALTLQKNKKQLLPRLEKLANQLVPHPPKHRIHSMVMGIPNVGKSTIINSLMGKSIAKTGNEPAVTRNQQRLVLPNGMVLSDTPGLLWPKLEDQTGAYKLAMSGAIRDTAIEQDEVALFAAEFLAQRFPELIKQYYKIESLPETDLEILQLIGRQRSCIKKGNRIDLNSAAEIFLDDIKNGKLGKFSFETSTEFIKLATK